MAEPLIFSDTYGIKLGRAEDVVKACQKVVDTLEANPTRHLYFAICINEQGTEYTNVQIHPDPDSMVHHMQLVAQHIQTAADLFDFSAGHEELYGTPSDTLREQLAQWGTSVNPPAGGFSRLPAPEQTASVSGPLVFVNSYALKDGAVEDYMAALPDWFAWNKAEHPRLLHHKVYLSENGTQVTNVQVHPDGHSMEFQIQLYSDRLAAVQQLIDAATMRIELVGSPSDALVDQLCRVMGAGVALRVKTPTLGFSRLPAG